MLTIYAHYLCLQGMNEAIEVVEAVEVLDAEAEDGGATTAMVPSDTRCSGPAPVPADRGQRCGCISRNCETLFQRTQGREGHQIGLCPNEKTKHGRSKSWKIKLTLSPTLSLTVTVTLTLTLILTLPLTRP